MYDPRRTARGLRESSPRRGRIPQDVLCGSWESGNDSGVPCKISSEIRGVGRNLHWRGQVVEDIWLRACGGMLKDKCCDGWWSRVRGQRGEEDPRSIESRAANGEHMYIIQQRRGRKVGRLLMRSSAW
jgi:hypothetical protein